MILRKPYAILIKNFKLIHILLFFMCSFLLFKLRAIYVFFKEYVLNDTYTYITDIASKYIGLPMFVVTILILISGILILFLMKEKEKPVLFYRILILYSFILLLALIVYNNFYISLEFQLYDRAELSIYRDIIGIIYYIMYFFVGLTFVRGFGFDIKKFSFDRDLKLLNISETDNEEFEVSVNVDKENIANTIRREKRFFSYFLKENALVLSMLLIISLLIGGGLLYRYIFVDNIVYKQGEVVIANNIEYLVNDVYLSNKDKTNQELDSNYLIVNTTFFNRNNEDVTINLSKIRLKIANKYYYPIINRYDSFEDIGVGYNNQIIKPQIIYDYIFVFKIIENVSNYEEVFLEVFDSESYINNEVKVKYQQIQLNINSFNEGIAGKYYLNEQILFNNSFLEKGLFKVIKYELSNSFVSEYQECIDDNCVSYMKVIQSDRNLPIIKFDYEINEINFEKISDYITLICLDKFNNNETEVRLNLLYKGDNFAFYEVEKDLNNLKLFMIKLNIRGDVYFVNLK